VIDIAAVARNVIRLIDANGITSCKAVILVGTEPDRDAVFAAVAAQTTAVVHNFGLELSDAMIASANARVRPDTNHSVIQRGHAAVRP